MTLQLVEKVIGDKGIVYLFFLAGLIIGLVDYLQMKDPLQHDTLISLFLNFFAHKILEVPFMSLYPAILIIPISIITWSAMGVIAYLIGRAASAAS